MNEIEKVMTKVIQPLELPNCDLTKANQELLAAIVINQLNTPTNSPLERYARARFLLGALERVCKEEGAAAEAYCETNDIGTDGREFEHRNLYFMRQFAITYNFAANDDVEGYEGYFKTASISERTAKNAYELAKVKRKGAEKIILQAHPNMQPIVDRVTIKLLMAEK